ncbi:DUF1918 domain-containing protein, partial [Rhizobium johnstonii]|uniref:DUF1918 domain-containing protein n=1 Tax=Rhizobium johnstonii TaxID=3019933 RepID=UPI003F983A8D
CVSHSGYAESSTPHYARHMTPVKTVTTEGGAAMHAEVGQRLVIHGKVVGGEERHGEIIEVRGDGGEPPYLVRFDDGHETLVFPGPDCSLEHAG